MPIEKLTEHGGVAISGKGIKLYQMLARRSALSLELKGLRMSRGVSVYAIVKREYGLKGNRQRVYEQFNLLCEQARQNYAGD